MNGLAIMLTQVNTAEVAQITSAVTASVMSKIAGIGSQILMIVGFWILFESKGERGWKAIIPIYSTYVSYKLFFKKSKFWQMVIFSVVLFIALIMLMVVGAVSLSSSISDSMGFMGMVALGLILISTIALIVISIQFDIAICKKYNMGFLFTLGMIFFMPIFVCILAYEVRAGRAQEIEE